MNRPSRDRILLIAFVVLLVVFAALAARKLLISRPPAEVQVVAVGQEEHRQAREVILYFASAQGEMLVAESRDIVCLEEVECVRLTVQALVKGPQSRLAPVLPDSTVVRGVEVQNGAAVIDFSRDLVSAHPGGSISELLTVYGVANTVAVNFPHIRQVRILVEGQVLETLKGHVGVREPVQADFRYSRSPEEGGAYE